MTSIQGLGLAALLLFWLFLCFLGAQFATRDIKEQVQRHPVPGNGDYTDVAQQAEIDRLHKVDRHFDSRLDRLERRDGLFWALLALNTLASIAQIVEVLR